jgi:hypothetical protein
VIFPQFVLSHAETGNIVASKAFCFVLLDFRFCPLELEESPRNPRTGSSGTFSPVVVGNDKRAEKKSRWAGSALIGEFRAPIPRLGRGSPRNSTLTVQTSQKKGQRAKAAKRQQEWKIPRKSGLLPIFCRPSNPVAGTILEDTGNQGKPQQTTDFQALSPVWRL